MNSTDPLAVPLHGTRYEYGELVLAATNYEDDPSCTFVPYRDYPDDPDFGERRFERYSDALNILGQAGWAVSAGLTNPESNLTKLILQRVASV